MQSFYQSTKEKNGGKKAIESLEKGISKGIYLMPYLLLVLQ